MSYCIQVGDDDFEQKVIENTKPVLVEFWAPWCGPCKMIEPVLDKLAEEYYGDIEVAKVNIDQNPEISANLQIRSVPFLMMFHKGDLLGSIVGAPDPNELIELFENTLDEIEKN